MRIVPVALQSPPSSPCSRRRRSPNSRMTPKLAPKKAGKKEPVEIDNVGEGSEKAKWNYTNTETFLKVCVEEIEAGNRPHTHFTKEGWANIVEKFHKQTSNKYNKKQMKNRWDALKQEFGAWAKLVEKETCLGWDPIKQTIIASSDWWVAKGKENPKYLNWKEQGPKCLGLMEKCFKGVIATDYVVFIPNRNPASYEEANDQDVSHDGAPVLEGEGDADDQHLNDINEGPSALINIQRKRKNEGQVDKRGGVAQKLQQSLDRILDGIDQVSNTTVTTRLDDCCSVTRCLTLLNDVPGLVKGSPQYLFATRIFINKSNRETFVHFMENTPEFALPWLNMFTLEDVKHYK